MKLRSRGIVTSVGYPFALAAICGLTLAPASAFAVEDDGDASSEASSDAVVSEQSTNASKASEKSETVYLFSNPDGSVKNTEVSTTLKNPYGATQIEDQSDLTDIENAESDRGYTAHGKTLNWDADGNDVYYTGNSSKQAPVSIAVTYFLDGQKTSADKLAGASGRLKIRYDYENTATFKTKINGKAETLYVPFTFVTAMLFDNENFKNAKVTNGKLIDDGDRAIVAGYAMPGLKKSLGSIVDDFDIPDYFEVEADVTDFEMKTSLTIATSGLLAEMNTDDIDTSKLEDASSELADAMDQILDGANTLSDGLDKLADGAKSAKAATGQLAAGIGEKNDTSKDGTLLGGINSLKSGYDKQLLTPVKKLQATVNEVFEENKTNITAAWEAVQGMDKAIDALDKAIKALGKVDKNDLKTAGAQLADLQEKLNAAKGAIERATGMVNNLKSLDMSGVQSGLEAVGANMAAAGEDVKSAGAALGSADITGNLTKIGASAQTIAALVESGKLGTDTDALGKVGGALSDIDGAITNIKGSELPQVGNYLTDAGSELTSGGATLKSVGDGLKALQSELPSKEEIAEIEALLNEANDALTTENLAIMNQSIDSLEKSLAKLDIDELNGEIKALKKYYPAITKYIESTSAQDAMKELQGKISSAVEGMEQVSDGLASEQKGLNTLREGVSQLNDGQGQLADGAAAAAEGSGKLVEGLETFNEEGIGEITDLIDEDLLPFTDRLDALSKAGGDYDNFAGITKGTKGSVKFIFETDPIEIADDDGGDEGEDAVEE